MKEEIIKLNKERNELLNKAHKIEKVIEAYQDVCKHNMQYTDHDSHYRYYKCDICGFENKI